MKETIAITIGPVVVALMIVIAWCLPKIQKLSLDHEYRMAQHRESVEQASHRRHLELETAVNVPSDLMLQARIAEANANERASEVAKEKERVNLERERNRERNRHY